ncbi:MAG: DUF4489 domain-containing protein [Clostridiaceae bacterium]|nr:DUF4489 domain-containing protein [Clostridiaceae bacterium]
MSRQIKEEKDYECRKPVICPEPEHPLPKPVLFECGNGGGFTYSAKTYCGKENNAICVCTPKTIANVNIDTARLYKPKIKVEFSSIIHFIPENYGHAQLEFDLVRCCKDFPECVIGTWTYEVEEDDKSAISFCFNYCDLSAFPGLCTYLVKIRPVLVRDATICVTNCQLAIFAQDN